GEVVGVQDDVDALAAGRLTEGLAPVDLVVRDRLGPEVADPLDFGGAAGGPDVGGAGLERHRDQQLAHPAAAAVDQHAAALAELGRVLHGRDGGEPGQGETGPAREVLRGDLVGDRGEVVRRDRDDLGGDSATILRTAHAEHA